MCSCAVASEPFSQLLSSPPSHCLPCPQNSGSSNPFRTHRVRLYLCSSALRMRGGVMSYDDLALVPPVATWSLCGKQGCSLGRNGRRSQGVASSVRGYPPRPDSSRGLLFNTPTHLFTYARLDLHCIAHVARRQKQRYRIVQSCLGWVGA